MGPKCGKASSIFLEEKLDQAKIKKGKNEAIQ
jgi:hypothetical protein